MRAAWVVGFLLLTLVTAQAAPETLYVDEDRTLLMGLQGVRTGDVAGVDVATASMFLPVDACHAELRGSLAWDPPSVGAHVGNRGVEVLTSVRVQVENDTGAVPGATWTFSGGFGSFVKRVAPSTDHRLVVTLVTGADVHVQVKVFGWVDPTDPSCR